MGGVTAFANKLVLFIAGRCTQRDQPGGNFLFGAVHRMVPGYHAAIHIRVALAAHG